ncbi:T9SS type A sorting domain-containing protein [Mucilaginibacter limnophilus]|uniref:T9SS type A sorting domain-containing protein n=1 Tax=Mucilaginibacter limnophilus TaxID=1932778 RepID=A0A437MYV3_9SPHI|nr:T9SS type A sorting domain-containing protein [Mucilaginibacter limnophilus]RVU02799.1 T9SS type A sorting domain-containing protein [Mucilaginibacter limnophilus]
MPVKLSGKKAFPLLICFHLICLNSIAQKAILQAFYLGGHYNGNNWVLDKTHGVPCPPDPNSMVPTETWHYDRIAKQANIIASSGFTAVWLPPFSKGNLGFSGSAANPRFIVGGIYDGGYGLFDDYDLGDKLQNGNYQTRYGSRTQLTRMIAMLRANGLDTYEDFILNHRSITANVTPIAPDYLWYNYKDAYGNNGGGRFPKYTLDFHNPNQYPAAPGGPDDPHEPNMVYPDGTPTGGNDGTFGPDFAHINGQHGVHGFAGVYCAQQLGRWGDWLIKATGIQGYRLDAAGGISWDFLKEFVQYGAMKDKFVYAELLTSKYGPAHVKQWAQQSMQQAGNSNFTCYDFSLQGTLQTLCRTNRFWMGALQTKYLSWGTSNEINPEAGSVDPGPYDIYRSYMVTAPNQAVTVVNEINSESGTNPLLPKHSLLGYAYTLTIGFGTPIVSYKDWSTDADCYGSTMLDDHNLNYHLNKLLWCHKFICTGGISNEYNPSNGWVYAFQKTGGQQSMVFLNSNQSAAVTLSAPTSIPDGTVLTDYTDHNITATVTNGKLTVTVPANVNGRGYLVMAPEGITGSFDPEIKTVTQEWDASNDLSIPPASNTQQEVCRIWVDAGKSITTSLLDYNVDGWLANTNLHLELNKTSLDNSTHVKVASRIFNATQKGQTLTYTTPAGDAPGYYSLWVKGNNLPDSTSNWWFNVQGTYTSSQTAPANFNDTIPTLVKARKVFVPDTVAMPESKFGVYPNPSNDTVFAEYQLTQSIEVQLKLIDMNGKVVLRRNEGIKHKGANKAELKVSGLSESVYFLQIIAGNKVLETRKIIKR